MTLDQLLKADMATIGAVARAAWVWWLEELRDLVPADWVRSRGPILSIDEAGTLSGSLHDGRQGWPTRATILIPDGFVLRRSIDLPAMSRADLAKMIALDSERYLPLPADTALLDTDVASRGEGDGMMTAAVAALPIERAREVASVLDRSGVVPVAVCLAGAAARGDRFDFLPAMQRSGLVAPARNAVALWWTLVAFLFAFNIAIAIWRDDASVARLQSLVDGQQPAVDVARRISAQMRRADALARRAADRRKTRDALGDLAAISAAVPDGAWVQRYVWEGSTLRLTGYRSRDADVAAALRRLPQVASVKSAQTEALAEIAAGEPFDLAVTMANR